MNWCTFFLTCLVAFRYNSGFIQAAENAPTLGVAEESTSKPSRRYDVQLKSDKASPKLEEPFTLNCSVGNSAIFPPITSIGTVKMTLLKSGVPIASTFFRGKSGNTVKSVPLNSNLLTAGSPINRNVSSDMMDLSFLPNSTRLDPRLHWSSFTLRPLAPSAYDGAFFSCHIEITDNTMTHANSRLIFDSPSLSLVDPSAGERASQMASNQEGIPGPKAPSKKRGKILNDRQTGARDIWIVAGIFTVLISFVLSIYGLYRQFFATKQTDEDEKGICCC